MSASKLLIVGQEKLGKTTLTSKIDKAFVVSIDGKAYPFKVPYYRPSKYSGLANFRTELIEKLKAYKAKHGEKPQTVVFDTVTKLYENMYKYAQANFKGFDVHNTISTETLSFNDMIEDLLIANGVNVVITAHVVYDEKTTRYTVPATGQFSKSGSWLSLVDNASFIFVQGNTRMIAHSELKYPARTTVDMGKSEKLADYSINDHMDKLMTSQNENAEYAL